MARNSNSSQEIFKFLFRKDCVSISDREKVSLCMDYYRTFGIVKNIIDLMSDFVSSGVRFIHNDKVKQEFWEIWARSIKIQNRTERYANTLLKAGFVVIRPVTGTLDIGEPYVKGSQKISKIPVQYIFVNPNQIYLYGNEQYGQILACYAAPKSVATQAMPAGIKEKLELQVTPNIKSKSGEQLILLDPKTTWIDTYKKDDWQTYADPYIFAAIPDLQFLEKLRAMDIAAADGVINVIRLFKLGETLPNGSVARPSPESVNKLDNMLKEAAGGGTADVIWDHMIKMEAEYPPTEKILGESKYNFVINSILADFGVPEILINGKGPGSYSNQFLGMKAFIEKLEYLREKVAFWLTSEVASISEKLGWVDLPTIKFSYMNLRDENSLQSLAKELVDRKLLSKKTALTYFDEDWDIEKVQIDEEVTEEEKNENLKSLTPFNQEQQPIQDKSKGWTDPKNGSPTEPKGKNSKIRDNTPKGQ